MISQSPEKRYVNNSHRTFAIHTRAQTVGEQISVHRVVAIRVPATSTDARIHVTRCDESPKEHMNKPVLVYVSSDTDHRGNVNILDLSKYAVG